MHITLNTFYSGQGDCIFFTLKEQDESYNILIDCGKYSNICKQPIDECLQMAKWHIHLLIVTHIDSDHLLGLISLLSTHKNLTIDRIWFNSYRRDDNKEKRPLSDEQREILKNIYKRLKVALDILGDQISAIEALSLSELILSNDSWRKAWVKNRLTADSEDVQLMGGRFGVIRFLSPTVDILNKLDKEFENAFIESFYDSEDVSLLEGESLYECLMRMISERERENIDEKTASMDTMNLLREAVDAKILPVTLHNKSSIAFVYEYKGHRFLFSGDADPNILYDSLKKKYSEERKPIIFDFIKVPHHGSAHSVTKELASLIDSPNYFFTGGLENVRPSAECVGRIIHAGEDAKQNRHRSLHFNNVTSFVNDLKESKESQEKFSFDVDTEYNCYEAEI